MAPRLRPPRGNSITADDVLQQFRTTGRAEVRFATAYSRRELITGTVIAVLLLALAIWMIPSSVSELLDADLSTFRRVMAAVVIGFYALAALVVSVLMVLAARRLRGSSPGLLLSGDGVRAARQAVGFRPVVPWRDIRSIELQRTRRGQEMVVVLGGTRQTPLPIGLAYEPEDLRGLLDDARRFSVGQQQ